MVHRLRWRAASACLLATTALCSPAFAQQSSSTTADQATQVDEIVVTARKQGEALLEAPATITVVSSEALQHANITQASELSGIVPGLNQAPGVSGSPATTLRGLGSNSSNFGIETSVAMFQDGIYLGRPRDYVVPLYDISQLELIKGTQSTLLGKNSSVGAISVVNRRPGRDFGYALNLTHSPEIGGTKAEGAVDLPLSEKLQARFAFLAADEDGFMHNAFLGRDEQSLRDLSGRLSLAWQPSESVDVVFVWQHDDRQADGQNVEAILDPAGVLRARATAIGQTDFDTLPNRISYSGSEAVSAGAVAFPLPFDEQTTDRVNLIATFDLGGYTLTSQTAYVNWQSDRATDLDFTRASLLALVDDEATEQFTQELRIASPAGRRYSVLAGAFFYHNEWDLYRQLIGQSGGGVFPLAGRYDNYLSIDTDSVSVFGSYSYDITERLSASAGFRYTHEEKEATYTRTAVGAIGAGFPAIPTATLPALESDEVDGDIGLKFQANDGLMLYGSFSRGSKSGGYLDTPVTTAAAPYAGEVAYTTEIGAKLDLGARGFATFALFNTDIEDFQTNYTALINGLAQGVIGNGDVRSRGFEAGGSYRVSDAVTLGASVVFAESEFTENFPTAAPFIATEGMPLPRAPKWTGKLEAALDQPLSDKLRLVGNASVRMASSTDLQFRASQPLAPRSDAYQIVDATIGIAAADDAWRVALLGTNLTDETYNVFATSISAGGGAYYGSVNRQRVIGIQLTLKH